MFLINRRTLAVIGASAAAVASTAFLGAPAQAAAGGAAKVVGSKTVQFRAVTGKANGLTITISGRTVTLDDKVAITPGKGCKAVSGDRTKVRCTTSAKTAKLDVNLGDKNDWVRNKTSVYLLATGSLGNDTLIGGAAGEELRGGGGNDTLYGNGGIDKLYGEGGNDTPRGGTGDDQIYAGTGNDRAYGEAGVDIIEGASGSDVVLGGAGGDLIRGGSGNDSIYGEAGEDFLVGEDGDDRILGGADADSVLAGAGRDVVYAGAGEVTFTDEEGEFVFGDYVDGGAGDDRLFGEGDVDVLFGSEGDDLIDAGTGDDVAFGEGGNDAIYGSDGDDILVNEDVDENDAPIGSATATDLVNGGAHATIGDICLVTPGARTAGCELFEFPEKTGALSVAPSAEVATILDRVAKIRASHS
ncbi:Ca2+-binding RTX toxin-like protein [Actinoplanes campanulatus]|uniref:Ca2+-binding RTX toxin-like protein n=1 Tax=Actinoplanes campanulatus TaxID=113559 RepID=A0A7W5FIF7_9ACTN|nr:calcium-binding protein [Actinoplanes campanulatus]MBB3099609.1 Ca2+-binding RTX toxin-like protein [Actinoplanes campanulatus]GGN26228.1 hypothetical protein GCM10010109_43000 [Actinoplanes campanulatus]GID41501.1 hypothetical protein Aca09nite_80070 [Actinoplanes campanulatus]